MSQSHHTPQLAFPVCAHLSLTKEGPLLSCVHRETFPSQQAAIYLTTVPSSCLFNAEIEKEKLCSSEDVEGGGAGAASAGGGSRGGSGGGGGVSASLTPAIWEKTIPYDGETFHLEYMDLDEFLLENGIPASLEEEELQKTLASVGLKGKYIPKVTSTATTTSAAAPAPTSASATSVPATSTVTSDPEEAVTVTTLQPAKLEEEEEEEEGQEDDSLSEEARADVEVKEEKTGEKKIYKCTVFGYTVPGYIFMTFQITRNVFKFFFHVPFFKSPITIGLSS